MSDHFKNSVSSGAQCITVQQLLTRKVGYLTTWPYITKEFGDVKVGPATLLPKSPIFSSQESMLILELCAIILFLGIIGCCVLKSLIK